MNVINNIGFAAVAAMGGILAVRGLVTVGVIASFLSYSRQFTRPLNELANIWNSLQTAVAGAERVFELMDQAEEPADRPEAVVIGAPAPPLAPPTTNPAALRVPSLRGEVELDSVSFGYRDDAMVIRDVSLHAAAGSVTALVGPTGAGKTTIVNLISRFYDVSSGQVRIDGRDVRDYARDGFRRSFGIVLQDSYLFSGTIRDNILYGDPGAGEAAMREAAAMANAVHFIERMPGGFDTRLQEGGWPLSEGQRQLVAIARAVLADPAILILDEATSSVDTRTELHIQEAMLSLMKGRTSFIIAHRLSTIRDADRILVLEGGRIIESGSHAELMASGGLYRRMYESQV
jgi:ATP-binding cassette subfamily B protein